ncbi:cytochrome b5 reductase 4-like isoform X1 [Varroa jacobsoni]|uniref:Cytochrome b5 reductase 4 n=1 Tax=Varroa destructor TaxID=109461 RepID=A0A7M7JJC5_VARDE|nr:cytochrome b5 reductase 4-like isoform X4 [Varroa destructor]XP_022688809.1 cytochrome b5 reductase 4-like isoform X1 [Varroa jacobsoni]
MASDGEKRSTTLTSNATGSGRNKVALAPGHSLVDWIRLAHREDLAGTGGRTLRVTPEELEKHCTPDDAWICIKGNVYNVTRYLDFHPGGEEELMRGVGSDATDLFNQVHAWVNYESMLDKCLVGKLAHAPGSNSPKKAPLEGNMAPSKKSGIFCLSLPKSLGSFFAGNAAKKATQDGSTVPDGSAGKITSEHGSRRSQPASKPQFPLDWLQDDCTVSVMVTCKTDDVLEKDCVAIDIQEKKFRLKIKVGLWIYLAVKDLAHEVYLDCNVCVNPKQKTVTVCLVKTSPSLSWYSLGSSAPEDADLIAARDYQSRRYFRKVNLVVREQITHDTYLFTFEMPKGTLVFVPVGQHVSLRVPLEDGSMCTRSYTPVVPSLEAAARSPSSDGRRIHLLIKIYDKGQMTQKLDSMSVGDQILMADSVGTFVVHRYVELENLVLLGAGTGFTPMVRMILWALYNCKDIKQVRLMSFHKTFNDIIWREQLEYLQQTDKRFIHDIILSEADDSWTGKTGRIRSELLRDTIPSERDGKLLVGICGPPPFTAAAAKLLQDSGYTSTAIHRFES